MSSKDLVERLEGYLRYGDCGDDSVAEAVERIKELERLDTEAANYVECVICMRTHFTGDRPYVGWKGLGLALTETLDRYDAAKNLISELESRIIGLEAMLVDGTAREQKLEAALHEIIAWWESEDEDIKVMEIATRALRGKS